MKRSILPICMIITATIFFPCIFCINTPENPANNPDNARIDFLINAASPENDSVYYDTIGDSVFFQFYRVLDHLIDSFTVYIDTDTSFTIPAESFPDDTIPMHYMFPSAGSKAVSYTLFFKNGTSRSMDSVATVNICYPDVHFQINATQPNSDSTFTDSIGDTVSFLFYPVQDNRCDSFTIYFDNDTSLTVQAASFSSDTIAATHIFPSRGSKSIGFTQFFKNGTSRTIDSIATINLKYLPFTCTDGDTLNIAVNTRSSATGCPQYTAGKTNLPDNSSVTFIADTSASRISLRIILPANSAGVFSVTVLASDSGNTDTISIPVSVKDDTPPKPPVFTSQPVVKTTTPVWNWVSGGNGGNGIYRYALDQNTIDPSDADTTDTTSYTTPVSLSDGVHTLLVQERDSTGNWSKTSSWPVLIDRNAPEAPAVSGTTPTNNPRPTWTWESSGTDNPRFRLKLDTAKFNPDSVVITATSFTPEIDLPEGPHTLFVCEGDTAGNWSGSGSFTINVDLAPPAAPKISGSPSTRNAKPTWSWLTGGGGNGTFRFRLDNDSLSGASPVTVASFTPETALSEGTHTLYVQERDSVSNWSESGSFAIAIDSTPPEAPQFTAASTSSRVISLTWKSGNGNGTCRYRVDAGSWSSEAAVTSYTSGPLIEKAHTFEVQERDDAGNWSASADTSLYSLPAPGILAATNYSTTSPAIEWKGIQVTWTDSATTDDSIFIYRATLDDCTSGLLCRPKYAKIASINAASTSYIDETVTSCTQYSYYVASFRSGTAIASSAAKSVQARHPKAACTIKAIYIDDIKPESED